VYEGGVEKVSAKRKPKHPLQLHPEAAASCFSSGRAKLTAKKNRKLGFEMNAAAFLAAVMEASTPGSASGEREKGQRLPVEVVAWTRLPYLSSGTTKRTHFSLDSALFVLRKGAAAD
jgi:hypothetical protein